MGKDKTKITRKWQQFGTASPEKGGGERYVEEKSGRDIKSLYNRMLQMGMLQQAAMKSGQSHGTKTEAIKLMNQAKKPPLYLNNQDIQTLKKEIIETETKMAGITKEKLINEELKKQVEKGQKEIENKMLLKELEFQERIKKEN